MNVEPNTLLIIQAVFAISVMLGILSLLYWVIENPILKDEEMRSVLEQSRSMRANALRKSADLVRQESERLYRSSDPDGYKISNTRAACH